MTYLGFFCVVRLEGKAFDNESILEEEDLDLSQLDKLIHAIFVLLDSGFLCDKIELFDSFGEDFSVNFLRQGVSVLRALVFKFFIYRLFVEVTFILA